MADSHVVLLLGTTLISIAQVFLVAISGFFLARAGLLPRNIQQALNRLNISLFTPSLLFSKVAFFLSPGELRQHLYSAISWEVSWAEGFAMRAG